MHAVCLRPILTVRMDLCSLDHESLALECPGAQHVRVLRPQASDSRLQGSAVKRNIHTLKLTLSDPHRVIAECQRVNAAADRLTRRTCQPA